MTVPTDPKTRFDQIDLLRGLACLGVLVFHYYSRGPRASWIHGMPPQLLETLARYGYLGVHLFFMISGFVIFLSTERATPRSFLASRAARLYPALWVGASLTAGTAWALGDSRFSVSPQDYLVNLTMLAHWFHARYVDGAYWSLAYELHFYILVWLALRFRLLGHVHLLLAGWLLVSAVNALRPMWPAEFWLDAKWAPFFAAGGTFYLIRARGMSVGRCGLAAAAYGLGLAYALGDARLQNLDNGPDYLHLPAVAAIVTVIFLVFWLIAAGKFRMRSSPLTYYAGILTYPVYLIHQNFGFMVFERFFKPLGHSSLALLLIALVVGCLAWTIHVGVERPLGHRLKLALGGSRPAPAACPQNG